MRRYLVCLTDPTSLLDPEAIADAEKQVATATDPIEKVRAHAALQRARSGDEVAARFEFINNARTWALKEQIPFDAFRQLGVPSDVLEAAGLVEAKVRKKSGSNGKIRQRAQKVAISDISAWMLRQGKPFTTGEIAMSIGGSPATIKKAIDELTALRKIRNIGVDTNHQARGRAPFLYTVVKEEPTKVAPDVSEANAAKPAKGAAKEAKAATKPRPKAAEKVADKELVSV